MADTEVVSFQIFVGTFDPALFNVLEVWRSRLLQAGPYDALTTSGAHGARIPALLLGDPPNPPITGPHVNIVGRQLFLRLNDETDITVTITGSDPLTYSQVAAQIQAQSLGTLRSFVMGGALVVETMEVGSGAMLEITGGDVAAITGLTIGVPSFGTEAYIPLIPGQEIYSFTDLRGSETVFYKTRLRNTQLNTASEFSEPLDPHGTTSFLDSITGFANLSDSDGSEMPMREVHVYGKPDGKLVNGRVITGLDIRKLTDKNGAVAFTLARGARLTVAVAGTNIVRDIVVPTDPAVLQFNLFDPAVGSDDAFKIDVPNVPYAVRRSL